MCRWVRVCVCLNTINSSLEYWPTKILILRAVDTHAKHSKIWIQIYPISSNQDESSHFVFLLSSRSGEKMTSYFFIRTFERKRILEIDTVRFWNRHAIANFHYHIYLFGSGYTFICIYMCTHPHTHSHIYIYWVYLGSKFSFERVVLK